MPLDFNWYAYIWKNNASSAVMQSLYIETGELTVNGYKNTRIDCLSDL